MKTCIVCDKEAELCFFVTFNTAHAKRNHRWSIVKTCLWCRIVKYGQNLIVENEQYGQEANPNLLYDCLVHDVACMLRCWEAAAEKLRIEITAAQIKEVDSWADKKCRELVTKTYPAANGSPTSPTKRVNNLQDKPGSAADCDSSASVSKIIGSSHPEADQSSRVATNKINSAAPQAQSLLARSPLMSLTETQSHIDTPATATSKDTNMAINPSMPSEHLAQHGSKHGDEPNHTSPHSQSGTPYMIPEHDKLLDELQTYKELLPSAGYERLVSGMRAHAREEWQKQEAQLEQHRNTLKRRLSQLN